MHVPSPPAPQGTSPSTVTTPRRPPRAPVPPKTARAATAPPSSKAGRGNAPFGMRERGVVNINLSPHRDLSAKRNRVQNSQQCQNFVPAREHEYVWRSDQPGQQKTTATWPGWARPVCPQRSPRFWWCYGHAEYKASEGEEQCFKQAQQILRRWLNHARRHDVRAAVIFDVVTTRRNLSHGEQIGKAIYRFIDEHYDKDVAFAFVGLTDNTARRVARDIFCRNEELFRKKLPWSDIDDRHLRVVYPDEAPRPPLKAAGRGAAAAQQKRRSPTHLDDL
eukprot:TRINITY_DN21631_c0_g1_i1.p1 TRINITY_DN21631_c0_g1~~TRINITY_DN21631_c0_g1_i1.p1  ORF type:complete len:295 (+),score=95.22 TRINITY_DN21631_c0_g1_i1:55-885(+)